MAKITTQKKIKTDKLSTRALFDSKTYNKEARTIDVVFATETEEVIRYDYANSTSFIEKLICEDSNVRMARLNAGAPVLNDHDKYNGVESILGTVTRAWIEGGEARATIKFSSREDIKPILQDIEDGIVRAISMGYKVYKYERGPLVDGETPIYRAIDWEPNEISFVVIPADIDATVRSEKGTKTEIELQFKPENKNENKRTMETPEEIAARLEKERADKLATDKLRKQATDDAVAAERARVKDINDAVRKASLTTDFATVHIEKGTEIADVRTAILDELAVEDSKFKTRGGLSVTVNADEAEKKRGGMENAILHRSAPHLFKLEEAGSEYRGMSLLRLAEDVLIRDGVSTKGMSERQIAMTALGIEDSNRAMSSSDFPIILGNTVNRTLQRAYGLAPRTFMPFTRATTARDFRPKTVAQLSGLVDSFKEIPEGGEYEATEMNEAGESYKVAKYGRIVPITWETIINDDLNAFSRIPTAIANKAAQKQSDIVWGIITANAAMSDTVALFHADHGNLAGSGGAINITTLGAARQAMREQTGLEGDILNLTPKFLVVGSAYEQLANQYTSASMVATKNSDINPEYNRALTVIVEPRLTGNQWYLISDPSMVDTIEYAFLAGEGELFTEQKIGFKVDGLQIKARMVFGAKAIDWRGMYKNVGA